MYSVTDTLAGGLPHSDIHGSTPARGSPWLFAACHVLHRLLVPRHPPNALITLDILMVRSQGIKPKPIPYRSHPHDNIKPTHSTRSRNRKHPYQPKSPYACTRTKQALLLSITHVGPTGLINRSITTTPLNVDAASMSQNVRKDESKQ